MKYEDLKSGMLVVWSDDQKSIFLKDTPQGDVFAGLPNDSTHSTWFPISDYPKREYFNQLDPFPHIVEVWNYATNMKAFVDTEDRHRIYNNPVLI